MDNLRKMKIWLSISLVLITVLFLISIYLFVFYLPSYAKQALGAPGEDISPPRVALLSMRIFINGSQIEQDISLNQEPRTFIAKPGKTAAEIASDLENEGFIAAAEDILLYWEYKGLDRYLRDGVYLIEPGSPLTSVGDRMAAGETGYTTFAFLPGWRKEEIDALLVQTGLLDSPLAIDLDFCQLNAHLPSAGMEGFLSPGTYQIPETIVGQDIYCLFAQRFISNLPDGFLDDIDAKGLSLYDAVTLASIVEKEMVDDGEAARIAGVFYNRLSAGMPLQSDPTVQYAVASESGGPVWWDTKITRENLEIESPFNTYKNNGLPPGPICNPSMSALLAVATPETHDFYYFRAACDGSGRHVFSQTYEQHLAAGCE